LENSVTERFEKKYGRGDGCWLWSAAKSTFGYGNFWTGEKYDVAHRVSYELYVGQIPNGMCVLHKCDVPGCVNPAHLFLGTHQDNIIDKVRKGRARGPHMHGKTNPQAKLSEREVSSIKGDVRPHRQIAKIFGISKSQVTRIKAGKSWANGAV
jgi:hypothetical protein